MAKHFHDGRSHCEACALEEMGRQHKEIADLQRQLQQAQEELGRLRIVHVDVDRAQQVALEIMGERDAAIERGVLACEVVQYLRMRWDISREENRLQGRMMLQAETDAAEQRASTIKVGEALMLAYANVGQDNWDKMDGRARQAINIGVAEWKHLVAPAEAQEEGDDEKTSH